MNIEETLKESFNENGIGIQTIENKGLIFINDSETIKIIKSNEMEINQISSTMKNNMNNPYNSNPQIQAQVKAEMEQMLLQLEQIKQSNN